MDMEGVRSSLLAAALLFLTLVVLAASASGDDAAAAAVDKVEEQSHPVADEPYMLVVFHNKDGEEIRLLADKGTETLSPSGFANRSGHWFYRIRQGKRRRNLPLLQSLSNMSREGRREDFWNTLGVLASSGDLYPATDIDGDDEQGYVLVGMQTSGGDKIRFLVVAGQRYFFITGHAKGWFRPPNWFFGDDGERHRLLPTLGGNGGSSHAEVVAYNVRRALWNAAGSS